MAEGGGQRPPVEYRSPTRKADGSLVRRDDPNRPPTAVNRFTRAAKDTYTGLGDKIQHTPLGKVATWLTGWREPSKQSGHPAGEFVRASAIRGANEVVDLHGPINNPDELSPADARLRDETKRRHPSSTTSGTDEPTKKEPYRWDSDPEVAATQTPVTELAGAATWQEMVDAKKLGGQPRPEEPGLKLVVDNDPKKRGNHTPPDDNGGGNAA